MSMKKALIAAFGLLCFCTHVQASGDNELGTEVSLTGGPIHHGSMGNNYPKAPVQPPYVTLDDHTLYIWSQHGGYTLTLLDDNDTVVYQTYVAAGVQFCALPPILSGSYTLQLSDDTYLFTGVIVV